MQIRREARRVLLLEAHMPDYPANFILIRWKAISKSI